MKTWILGIWLGGQGCTDFKYKEIPLWISILGIVTGIIFCFVEKRSLDSIFLACIPGLLALAFAKISKEVMGYGDGITLLAMGTFITLEQLISVGMIAFSMAGVVALVLLVFFRKGGSYRLPFIPFLCAAYILECSMRLGGGI